MGEIVDDPDKLEVLRVRCVSVGDHGSSRSVVVYQRGSKATKSDKPRGTRGPEIATTEWGAGILEGFAEASNGLLRRSSTAAPKNVESDRKAP